MKIIKSTLAELETLSGLFDLYRQFYKQKSDLDSAKKFLSDRIINNESEIFLAFDEEKNKGMGFTQLYPSFSSVSMKNIWILNDLFVHKDFRKQGVALALMEKARELAVQTNSKGIALETHNTNANAQRLYEKLGYQKDPEHYYYYLKI